MTHPELMLQAETIADQIQKEQGDARLNFLGELSRAIQALKCTGAKVPARLRRLEAELCEEMAEAQFDNMPV